MRVQGRELGRDVLIPGEGGYVAYSELQAFSRQLAIRSASGLPRACGE
jgi:hypothetical protein